MPNKPLAKSHLGKRRATVESQWVTLRSPRKPVGGAVRAWFYPEDLEFPVLFHSGPVFG